MSRMLSRVTIGALRTVEIVAAAVVLGIMAHSIKKGRESKPNQSDEPRMGSFSDASIFATAISASSILIALLQLAPMDYTFTYFPLDFIIGVAGFACFSWLMVKFDGNTECNKDMKEFSYLTLGGTCNQARAVWGFAFLSGCIWIASSVVGCWVLGRDKKLQSRRKTTTAIVG